MDPRHLDIRALAFDVFGTVVDWRGSLLRETESIAAFTGVRIDWTLLVDEWRAAYQPSLERVRRGERPWTKLDVLHRESLDRLLEQLGGTALDEESRDELNHAWHRLDPWPDAVAGLTRLRRRFILTTLSNGNVALLVNMARRAGLPWDCILSAELFRAYKPDPRVYRGAAELLGLT